jgi:hypothetical protein
MKLVKCTHQSTQNFQSHLPHIWCAWHQLVIIVTCRWRHEWYLLQLIDGSKIFRLKDATDKQHTSRTWAKMFFGYAKECGALFSSYLKVNTSHLRYEDQLIIVIYGSNYCLFWESTRTQAKCEQNTYLLNGDSYHYHCVLRKGKDGKK